MRVMGAQPLRDGSMAPATHRQQATSRTSHVAVDGRRAARSRAPTRARGANQPTGVRPDAASSRWMRETSGARSTPISSPRRATRSGSRHCASCRSWSALSRRYSPRWLAANLRRGWPMARRWTAGSSAGIVPEPHGELCSGDVGGGRADPGRQPVDDDGPRRGHQDVAGVHVPVADGGPVRQRAQPLEACRSSGWREVRPGPLDHPPVVRLLVGQAGAVRPVHRSVEGTELPGETADGPRPGREPFEHRRSREALVDEDVPSADARRPEEPRSRLDGQADERRRGRLRLAQPVGKPGPQDLDDAIVAPGIDLGRRADPEPRADRLAIPDCIVGPLVLARHAGERTRSVRANAPRPAAARAA